MNCCQSKNELLICSHNLFGFSSYKGAVSDYEVIPVELPETHMNLNLKVVLSLKLKCVVILLTWLGFTAGCFYDKITLFVCTQN